MRKIIFTVVAAASLLGMTSCENGLGNKDPQQAKYTDYSGGRIQLVLPASKTVEADADGVSISIKQLDASNVVFECRPGANVLSYYVDVIPLSLLYNTLINEDLVDASRLEVEDVITKLLMGSASTNGVVFSEKNLDDYYSHTFDWMNSTVIMSFAWLHVLMRRDLSQPMSISAGSGLTHVNLSVIRM